jgi:hypothetical protein
MMINEMSREDCQALLTRGSIARLGCSLQDQPYVVPVYFAYEPDYIYIFSTLGQKIEWMRTNPKVCVEVDEVTSESQWMSVIANGQYQELPVPRYQDEHDHAQNLFAKRHHWWLNALAQRRLQLRDQEIEPLFFRILIDSMTGLAAIPDSQDSAA